MSEVLTIKEAADKLRVSADTIVREITRGRLEALKIGKQWRIELPALEKYTNSRRVKVRA